MVHYILAAIGGAMGATLRYLVGGIVQNALNRPDFPYSTLLINVVGCLVFGLIIGLVDEGHRITPEQRTFMLVGVLGGFTTFSTFGYETFAFLRDGEWLYAMLNIGAQTALGVLGVWLGTIIARFV
ncbi:MAG: fluoride efflux transporter CrcB [Chloroflexi bacterium]|nr:fluoride efflux transporter CrcB [Chloroflexota bacterium]